MAKVDRFAAMKAKTKQRAAESEREGFFSYLKFPEGEKVNFFNPKKGTHEVDILPYEITKTIGNPDGLEKGDVFHRRLIYVHEKVGSANKKYLCPSTIGKPCPICEARSALYAEGTAESKILAGGLRKKVRELRNVIVLTTPEDKKKGIQLWNSSHPLFGDLLEKEIRDSQRKDRSGFAMLEGGNTLTLRFDEKTIGEKGKPFPFCDRIDFDARDDYDEDILEDVFDLDACLDVLSYDELEKIFLEVEVEEKEEEEEEPKKKRKSKDVEEDEEPPKRSRKVKEEEEEEEPPKRKKKVIEEEPEDEEPPKRSRRSRVEEPEEEEEPPKRSRRTKVEEEPEEEEEPPKRKKKVVEEEEEPPKRSKHTVVEEDDEPTCPVKGGVFGKDVNKYDEGKHNCFDCEQWKACKKENDRLKGK